MHDDLFDDGIDDEIDTPHIKEDDGELRPITTIPTLSPQQEEDERLREEVYLENLKQEIGERKKSEIPENDLTERESQVLYVLRTIQDEWGLAPSSGQIAQILSMTYKTVHQYIWKLRWKGYLEQTQHKSKIWKKSRFPRGGCFAWWDEAQFPSSVFPENVKKRKVFAFMDSVPKDWMAEFLEKKIKSEQKNDSSI